ncbi:5044_t:CDS:2 [Dentiscutata erythropus]|uniref:5044_t:CDS:1 n=1 Tax=Dentiscutata erythropus TaxID=1348616 RepID=A0A9N9AVK6_9GLOM|nr:5044_t:CDS:2 [Dentiscutata erythropus]
MQRNAAVNIVLRDPVPTELKQIQETLPDSTTQRTIPAILIIVFGKKRTGLPTTFSLEFLKECKKSLTVFARVNQRDVNTLHRKDDAGVLHRLSDKTTDERVRKMKLGVIGRYLYADQPNVSHTLT